jgi:hypothetical protein
MENNILSSLRKLLRNRLIRVCLWVGGCYTSSPPPLIASSITIYAKTTMLCTPDSSMPPGL